MKKTFEDAIEKAFLKLSTMDDAEFTALLKNNENGDYAKIVRATNFPDVGIFEHTLSDFEISCHPTSFYTYIQSSHKPFIYENILTEWIKCYAAQYDIPKVTVGWMLNGYTKIVKADNYDWDIQDQEYLWAIAA